MMSIWMAWPWNMMLSCRTVVLEEILLIEHGDTKKYPNNKSRNTRTESWLLPENRQAPKVLLPMKWLIHSKKKRHSSWVWVLLFLGTFITSCVASKSTAAFLPLPFSVPGWLALAEDDALVLFHASKHEETTLVPSPCCHLVGAVPEYVFVPGRLVDAVPVLTG